jgi:hypothetical protein
LPNKWQYEKEHKAGYMDIFRISSFEQTPVKLHMGLLSASLLKEEYPLSEKYLTKVNDNEWLLETNVSNFEGVGRFILGLLDDIKIISPQKLKNFIYKKISNYVDGKKFEI